MAFSVAPWFLGVGIYSKSIKLHMVLVLATRPISTSIQRITLQGMEVIFRIAPLTVGIAPFPNSPGTSRRNRNKECSTLRGNPQNKVLNSGTSYGCWEHSTVEKDLDLTSKFIHIAFLFRLVSLLK